MAIRILLLSLLALLIGSIWLGYQRGPFKDLRLLFPASVRHSVVPLLEIPVLHQYRHGSHAYVGEALVPSTCHHIDAESVVRESYPEQVSINLSILPDEDQSLCEHKATLRGFKIAFQASPEARISVNFEGKPATFVITEASSTTSLEALPIN